MQRAHDLVDEGGTVVRETRRSAWSPAQLIDVVIGVLLVVLGGVGLARTGTNFSNLDAAHSQVAGLGVTPLSAVAELVAGILLLAGAAYAASSKAVSALVGVVMLAFGLIVALDRAPFHRAWNYGRTNGIVCAIVGAVLLVSAIASPIFSSRRRVVVGHVRPRPASGVVESVPARAQTVSNPADDVSVSQPVSPDPLETT